MLNLTSQSSVRDPTTLIRKQSLFKHGLRDIPLIAHEIENAKKDTRIIRVDNIIERFPLDENVIISPCFGDPSVRSILSGGFMTVDAFIKTDEFVYFNEYSFQRGGPRLQLALKPEETKVAIVLSGATCPGLNVALRELTMCLWFNYGVREIWGVKHGISSLENPKDWMTLNPDEVSDIHELGGTILGSVRGTHMDEAKIVDNLQKTGVNVMVIVGGMGTCHLVKRLEAEIVRRNLKISVALIPKTLDNDIPMIDRSFGFETCVEEAAHVISRANSEAECAPNGIGLVKLYGRESGFIAMSAANASRDVNICLIPEQKFDLYGPYGLLEFVFKRLQLRGHCLIVVSEGAAYSVSDKNFCDNIGVDKFGQKIYPDIGLILKDEIETFAKKNNVEINLKYIDPTFLIASCKANGFDTDYATKICQNTIHSIFAGFTNFMTGFIETRPVIIPVDYVLQKGKRKVETTKDPDYRTLLASTGQASFSERNARLTKPVSK